jgi:hypothetical protein
MGKEKQGVENKKPGLRGQSGKVQEKASVTPSFGARKVSTPVFPISHKDQILIFLMRGKRFVPGIPKPTEAIPPTAGKPPFCSVFRE